MATYATFFTLGSAMKSVLLTAIRLAFSIRTLPGLAYAVTAGDPSEDPSVPVAAKVTAYDRYDDPFAVPDGWTWQPDNLDDFATEEAAEPVLIRVGSMAGADECGCDGWIHSPCLPS